MNDQAELESVCRIKLTELAERQELPSSKDQCDIRLDIELNEINKKNEAWYFLRFYNRGVKVDNNENNLFVCWLLGICPKVNFNKSPVFTEAELPDIDVDYHPDIRDYLKDEYTPKEFGKDFVCNITSYQTYGIKSSLADVAKVLGEDKDEILSITTRLGMKDDDGDDLTFESMEQSFQTIKEKKAQNKPLGKVEKLMVELELYKNKYPHVWEVAKNLVCTTKIDWKDKYKYGKPPHRKKSMSMHASGLIVTGVKLSEFVPLVVPPGSREIGLQSSAWVEGLADTDCSSVGLIKFDYLSLEANAKIAECNRLIMERYSLDSICALPGLPNWSDTSYLNDPKALVMANAADLKGIFQFDSDGIRKMVKKGGVTSFEDLVAYSALYRPGPMDCLEKSTKILISTGFVSIKDINPLIDKLAYVNNKGKISYTKNYIKSEKKTKKILKIKLKNGKTIVCSPEHKFLTETGTYVEAKDLLIKKCYVSLLRACQEKILFGEIESIEEFGEGDCYDLCVLEDDVYLNEPNYIAEDIIVHNSGMHDEYCDRKNGKSDYELHPLLRPILNSTYGVIVYQEQCMRVLNVVGDIPLKDCETVRKAISKKKRDKFEKYEKQFLEVGQKKLDADYATVKSIWDSMAAFAEYAFNKSHSCAYTYISARQLWQKANYPLEFYASALKSLKTADERIVDYIRDARKHNVSVNRLDIYKSKVDFEIVDNKIYYGFGKIKGIGKEVAERIVEHQPYTGFQDFLEKFGTEAKVLQPLICLNVFKEKDALTMHFYYEAYKKALKQKTDRRTRNKKSVARYMNDLQSLLGDRKWDYGFDDNHMGALRTWLNDEQWIALCTLKKKYDNCLDIFANKDAEKINLSLNNFDPKTIKLSKSALKTFKSLKPILVDVEGIKAEEEFYGFSWMNPLERCPNYRGFTFEQFDIDRERLDSGEALPVEVIIESVELTTSKSGKMQYYKIRALDGVDGKARTIRVWEHDYERFERILQKDNCVRLRMFPPSLTDKGEEIPGHSFEGVLPWKMRGKNPYGENPEFDARAVLLKEAEKKTVAVTDENLFEDIFTDPVEEGEDE